MPSPVFPARFDGQAYEADDAAMPVRKVVGCMTGTSIDALDVALLAIEGRGLDMRAALLRCHTQPLGPLAEPLRRLASQEPFSAGTICGLAHQLADFHASAIRHVLAGERADLIAAHGQTVFHRPPRSWQLLNPAPLAHVLHTPVVFDLRAADLAAGGQGAPITPLADYILFRAEAAARAIVNFGGYCNFTLLPRAITSAGNHERAIDAIRGGDICACDQLLDGLARTLLREPFDADGRRAAAGTAHAEPRDSLVDLLRSQARTGRSLGTGDELAGWAESYRDRFPAEDLLRSACEALAEVIVEAIEGVAAAAPAGGVDEYLLAGGGVKNQALCAAFTARCRGRTALSDAAGIPAAHREAAGIAVLGALCQDRVPITLPAITGTPAPAPLSGVWVFPG